MTDHVRGDAQVNPRRFSKYYGPEDDRPQGERVFCGACDRDIGGIYGHNYAERPKTLSDFLNEQNVPYFERRLELRRDDEPLSFYGFCPWCGVRFPDDWWKRDNSPIENERVPDHFRNPGSHKGDTHEFVGPFEQHVLGSSDPSYVCWCDPEITPSITGCVIRHTAVDYETWRAMQPPPDDDDDEFDEDEFGD